MRVSSAPISAVSVLTVLVAGVHAADRTEGFGRGNFTLACSANYAHGCDQTPDVGSLEIAGNWFMFDNFSLGAAVAGFGVSQPDDNALAAGVFGVCRHHFYRWEGGSVYFDAAFGPVEASERVPEGGTRFNFLTRVGLGTTWRLDDRLHLMTGARYWHLSNANINGEDRNPAINGVEVYGGLVWSL